MSNYYPKNMMLPTASKTWFPILVGVLAGLISWLIPPMLDRYWISDISAWIFDEPVDYKSSPSEYYFVLRTVLLILCAIGGSIGIAFSRWRIKTGVLFLSCVLLVIGLFLAMMPTGL